MTPTTALRFVNTPRRLGSATAALLGWCLLLAVLLAVAVLDARSARVSSREATGAPQLGPRTADTLCVGGELEVRMCKVARSGFTAAIDY